MADALREQVDGLELIVPLHLLTISTATVLQANDKRLVMEDIKDVMATDSRYFKLMHYEWLAGNPASALKEPNQLVLTQSRAHKYFPARSLE